MNSIRFPARKALEGVFQAWKGLALHRFRSLLSTLGIVVAVAAVVTMLSIAGGAGNETMEQIRRLGIDNIIVRSIGESSEPSARRFTHTPALLGARDVNALKLLPGVENITLVREANAVLAELGGADVTNLLFVSPGYPDVKGLKLAEGRFFSDADVQQRHRVCVLGAELAIRTGWGAGPGSMVHLDGDPYRVVGVLQPRGRSGDTVLPVALRDFDNAAFIPLQTPAVTEDDLSEIIIKISNTGLMDPVAKAVHHVLSWNRDGIENFQIIIPRELLSQARQTRRLFNIVMGGIAVISLLVGGIGIMNIMLANVSERTREIGIRRAIGASREHIVAHFLGEAILLTVMGGILGAALGAAASLGVAVFTQWQVSLSPWTVLSALFISIGVGIASGIYPAIKAAGMNPVEALRRG